jgi:hypothetical protein
VIGAAEIEPYRAGEPFAVGDGERVIEAEALAQPLDGAFIEVRLLGQSSSAD